MTKEEAYQAMLEGHKVTNLCYTPDEYAFINKDGKIETEDGCVHGYEYDEFWAKYQTFPNDWSIYEEKKPIGFPIFPPHVEPKERPIVVVGGGAGDLEAGRIAMACIEESKKSLPLIVAGETPDFDADFSKINFEQMAEPYLIRMRELGGEDLHKLLLGSIPNKLDLLRKLKLSPEQIDYFKNAPQYRLKGESQEDYKTRRTLNKLIIKYRGQF